MPLAANQTFLKCRVCSVLLKGGDDRVRGVCLDCHSRPEAQRFLFPSRVPPASTTKAGPTAAPPGTTKATPPAAGPRAFTAADKSLIKHTHGYMPAAELLRILNDRLVADVGASAGLYTMEQLHAEVQHLIDPAQGADWGSLRKLLAQARRSGVLTMITAQTIEDFATVFQLTPAQLMSVRDVIRNAQAE